MGVLPDTRIGRIEWFEQRLAAWLGNAAQIGLTNAQVMQLQTEIAAARVAYNTAQQARSDSRSATVSFYDNEGVMTDDGRDLIKTIKAFAETSGDANVYVLANVPPPAEPEPIGAPGMPYDITTLLDNDGHIILNWKADNGAASTGAYYMIERRLNGEASFTLIGGSGTKSYTDVKIPLGTNQAIYKIKPRRGDLFGPSSNQVTVQFGVNIPGPGNEGSGENGLNLAA
jgi:hypothetical protein